ncbi:2-amino-4-hydroxy-6-hydroxymethyldihydropteridine diphosphokinase [Rubrivirga sp. IMCC45206]|uniref:2-amino-4-hydroxy-6- hydroxymethyldihydropteridine diphosphokinase n=1 Tax=Rubrivirga sp. IMCC45206 TaxID=3391614 RepID=UPI00398FFAF1
MRRAYVGLGANVGDRLAALQGAVAALDARADTDVVARSEVYETEALVRPGAAAQPDHLNAAVALDTTLRPSALLRVLHAVERAAGRRPDAPRWAPRPLDLDLVLYGDCRVDRPGLHLPHPGLATRRFVLAPLADIAAGRPVPGLDRTVADLLAACEDGLRLERTDFRL